MRCNRGKEMSKASWMVAQTTIVDANKLANFRDPICRSCTRNW